MQGILRAAGAGLLATTLMASGAAYADMQATDSAGTAAQAQTQTAPGMGRMPEHEGGAPLPSERRPDGGAAAIGVTEGMDVVGARGEKIGEVKAVEGDQVVVSVGGFLGMGARDVALDLGDVQISGTGGEARLQTSLTQEELEKLPAYETAPGMGRLPENQGGAPLPSERRPAAGGASD